MKYIFGVVNSRRFGKSLGIDLSPEKKQCNFDCLYCELNKSKPVSHMENEPEPIEIFNEVKEYLRTHTYPDVITITANGEPTLYSRLDELIDLLNKIKGKSKLLILTNGSTIYKDNIKKTLSKLDIVKISLDAVSEKIFRKVDRPLDNISIKNIIEGIKDFRKIFKGELIIEILLVKNVNDTEENIKAIREVLKEIKPNRVDLGTIDRPPAYKVKAVSNEKLLELGKLLEDFNLNILLRRDCENSFKENLDLEEILEIIKRRPLPLKDLDKLTDEKTKSLILEKINKKELFLTKLEDKEYILFR